MWRFGPRQIPKMRLANQKPWAPPFNLGISAYLALSDAIAACGDGTVYPDLRAPATAEAIRAAIKRVERHV